MMLRDRVRMLIETAADRPVVDSAPEVFRLEDVEDAETVYYMLALQRANRILDRNKQALRQSVLSINNRAQMERALVAYSTSYLMGLNLSLDAISELAQDLVRLARDYRCVPPQAWLDIATFNTGLRLPAEEPTYPRRLVDL